MATGRLAMGAEQQRSSGKEKGSVAGTLTILKGLKGDPSELVTQRQSIKEYEG